MRIVLLGLLFIGSSVARLGAVDRFASNGGDTLDNSLFADGTESPAPALTDFLAADATPGSADVVESVADTDVFDAGFAASSPSSLYGAATTTQSVTSGGNVTLTASAEGAPTLSFQWCKNGIPITGATSLTLTLRSISEADAASYTVIVTNTQGTAVGGPVTLVLGTSSTSGGSVNPATATSAPKITLQPISQVVDPSTSVIFTAMASGNPAPSYQWYKNGAAMWGATGASLTLPSVSSANAASYSVIASNSAGSVSSNVATLTVSVPVVNVAPTFVAQPANQTASFGETIAFSASATGTPTPTYQWKKNGANISGATTSTLVLSSVSSVDAANYTVVASNVVGTVTSTAASLTLKAASSLPSFTQQPASRTASYSETIQFTALASGSPAPTYQWKKNGANIPGATGSTLTITAVGSGDAGTYTVVAMNILGFVTSNAATLTVMASAPVFTQQPVSQVASASDLVQFTALASGSPAPAYQWWKDGYALSGATGSTLTLGAVTAGDAGSYVAVASNIGGSTSSAAATLTVKTTTTAALPPPIVFQSRQITVSSGFPQAAFTISGTVAKRLLVRVAGPSYAAVSGTPSVTDPNFWIYKGSKRMAGNDNWDGSTTLRDAFALVGAFPFVSTSSKDAAAIVTLDPGNYSLLATSVDGSLGAILIEIYELP